MTSEEQFRTAILALAVYANPENWEQGDAFENQGRCLFNYLDNPSVLAGWEPAQDALKKIAKS